MTGTRRLELGDYDPAWPARFAELGAQLRSAVGGQALRIDHIGSTSVPGLAAKNVIDIQITVADLATADEWSDELLPGLVHVPAYNQDHVPPNATSAGDWGKRMWSAPATHVHVRQEGWPNQRYALLFRDYLRADPVAAGGYERVKRALIARAPDDWETYYAVKDPACDLIFAGAEQWASRSGWQPGPSDA